MLLSEKMKKIKVALANCGLGTHLQIWGGGKKKTAVKNRVHEKSHL
jgi:hypothetical protein